MSHRRIWDFWARRYEGLWVQKQSLTPTRQLVVAEINKYLRQGTAGRGIHLLDVGCGTGQLAKDIQEGCTPYKIRFTGVDYSPGMIKMAQRKKLPKTRFVCGNAEDLPFAAKKFDIVTCCHSLPYYPDKNKVLREFVRVLKPGGRLLLVQASQNNAYDTLILSLIKLTTGRASYPSAAAVADLLRHAGIPLLEQKTLETRFYIPTILLSIGQLEMDK